METIGEATRNKSRTITPLLGQMATHMADLVQMINDANLGPPFQPFNRPKEEGHYFPEEAVFAGTTRSGGGPTFAGSLPFSESRNCIKSLRSSNVSTSRE